MCAAGLAARVLARQVQMIEDQTSKFDRSIMPSPISITTLAALARAGVLRTVQLVRVGRDSCKKQPKVS
ncbi:hypothetical protein XcvCFBP7112P_22685 (plasmid) [Xanthomonas citri pv. vignicola]|nr:hypothetical protein XcvCFBP7112P_22685 [Xanthomonas citri pv. vignicola]